MPQVNLAEDQQGMKLWRQQLDWCRLTQLLLLITLPARVRLYCLFLRFRMAPHFSLESDLFQIGPIHIEMMVNSGETFGYQFFAGLNNALVRYQVYVFNFSAPVPEPHILLLIGLGLILLLGFSPANSFRLVKC
ncbi:MAG: hypothetical protein H6940_03380 [Burkholderiales bacterium]|uniref:hypothetical protein n=1 Tax=Nitrosomonas sp. TaxID=42353 RepID=UPI001D6E3F44|nr:hypothetical protein [Nitrosomonas sp.]MCB1948864.1 hypothetical protein [Nitrosomonas sp.]MCP5242471.1 hypothetical protein [Burkholderiales bacterium]